MTRKSVTPFMYIFICSGLLFMTGCGNGGSSSEPSVAEPSTPAPPEVPVTTTITPAINPAFDTVDTVAYSLDSSGPYDNDVTFTYDASAETITTTDELGGGGVYVRVSGDATIGGASGQYQVYTFVASRGDAVSATELTSAAVGRVADGQGATFEDGLAQIADEAGVSTEEIIDASKDEERSAGARAFMIALQDRFLNGAFVPGVSSAASLTDDFNQCVELGGAAYSNFTKTVAGGSGELPSGVVNVDYVRCKACHGWDQLGTDGGYAHRSRQETRPNAGWKDADTTSRNISTGTFGVRDVITEEQILKVGGRSYANGTDSWVALPENPTDGELAAHQRGFLIGNQHPDFSEQGVNAGTGQPMAEQVKCLAVFVNYPKARADRVFAAIEPTDDDVLYTLMSGGDIARGEARWNSSCLNCHGAPDADVGPVAGDKPGEGGMVAFVAGEGKPSEFMHKVQWGDGPIMTPASMGNPKAADVVDLLAYLNSLGGLGT